MCVHLHVHLQAALAFPVMQDIVGQAGFEDKESQVPSLSQRVAWGCRRGPYLLSSLVMFLLSLLREMKLGAVIAALAHQSCQPLP